MEIEVVRKLIKKHTENHSSVVKKCMTAERYYRKKNDIIYRDKGTEDIENPLRNADNRIPSNFYGLLVKQKASYMFAAPPLFDSGDKGANDQIVKILGDSYAKTCKSLCIKASNCMVSWLHVWKDLNGNLKYGVVDTKEIIPVWSSDLEKRLLALLRVYNQTDETDGEQYNIYEYWTETECYAYRKKVDAVLDELIEYRMFSMYDAALNECQYDNVLAHDFKEVPFIPFFNNDDGMNDLENIKELIDVYDKVFSGFINDLEDIQEIIFVLSGYAGTDLNEFLHKLKKYKTIKVDNDEDGKGGVNTLSIDIPVEARKELLTMTRKAIFEQGQGIDPDPSNFGNSSGVALSYLYSLLELKAGLTETEFKLGFGRLVRIICNYIGYEPDKITQTWTRTSVSNDAELADIAVNSKGVISDKTIIKNHPWVENTEEEVKQLKKEQEERESKMDPYVNAFNITQTGGENGDDEE